MVRLWNPETGELQGVFREHENVNNLITELAFSPDGEMIASGGTEWPTLYVWDTKTGKVRFTHHSHNWSIDALAFSPDGTKLAIGGDSDAVEWLDLVSDDIDTSMSPQDHPGRVDALAFSPDGKTLTTVSQNGTIRFWGTTNGDQRFPAIWSADGTILLWDWHRIRTDR